MAVKKPAHPAIRIVIVDRSPAFVAAATGWIADQPDLAVVGTARTGPEGLDAVARLAPELVLVDAVLPELDGFELVRRIKARARAPLAVMTTLFASEAVRGAAFEAGADGFLPKDDFAGAFELLLGDLTDGGRPRTLGTGPTRSRSDRPGSRTEPDP